MLYVGFPLASEIVQLNRNFVRVELAWAAFINTVSAPGIADLPLTLIVFTFVFVGSALGMFSLVRVGGIATLGVVGGLALGVRIVVVKDDLLVASVFFVNWLVASVFGLLGGLLVVMNRRTGIVSTYHGRSIFDSDRELIAMALNCLLARLLGIRWNVPRRPRCRSYRQSAGRAQSRVPLFVRPQHVSSRCASCFNHPVARLPREAFES